MKKNQVNYIHVPHWDELSVKRMWADLCKDAGFNIYFQDKYQDAKGPNRDFFFNILNTVYPDYLTQVMQHASHQRFAADGEKNKTQSIKATDEWISELQNMPFKSGECLCISYLFILLHIGKNGKTLFLLKQSAKILSEHFPEHV